MLSRIPPFFLRHRWFLLLLALFVVLRLLAAASSLLSFDDEDGFTMSSVVQLLGEQRWPWHAYQISDWEGGSLVVVLLAVPWYLLFGHSLFALQITGVTVGALTLMALYLLCRQSHGPRAAHLACLLYVCFPGPVLQYNLVAHGFHPDSVMLQLLFLWMLSRALRSGKTCRYLGCGLLGGFAIYFAYISALCVVAGSLALVWLLWRRQRRAGLGRLLPYAAGLALGLMPLVGYNLATGFAGLGMEYNVVTSEGSRNFVDYLLPVNFSEHLTFFLDNGLDAAIYFSNYTFRGDHVLTVLNLGYWAAALAALLLLGWRRRVVATSTDLAILGTTLLTAYLFCTSRHPVGVQHMVHLLVLQLPSVAARALFLWDRDSRLVRVALAGGLCLFVGLGLAEGISLIKPARLGISLSVDGRNDSQFYQQQKIKLLKRNLRSRHEVIDRMFLSQPMERARVGFLDESRVDRHVLFAARFADILAKVMTRNPRGTLFAPLQQEGSWARFRRALLGSRRSPGYFTKAGFLVGSGLVRRAHKSSETERDARVQTRETVGAIHELIHRQDPGRRLAFLAGVGYGLPHHELENLLRAGRFNAAEARTIAWGQGRAVGLVPLMSAPRPQCGAHVDPRYRDAFIQGIGAGLRCQMLGKLPAMVARRICPARRAAFRRGWDHTHCRKSR